MLPTKRADFSSNSPQRTDEVQTKAKNTEKTPHSRSIQGQITEKWPPNLFFAHTFGALSPFAERNRPFLVRHLQLQAFFSLSRRKITH